MRLCTYLREDDLLTPRSGIASQGLVYDILDCLGELKSEVKDIHAEDCVSVLGILKGGRNALDAVRRLEEAVEKRGADLKTPRAVQFEEDITLLAPIPRPNSIRGQPLGFPSTGHRDGGSQERPGGPSRRSGGCCGRKLGDPVGNRPGEEDGQGGGDPGGATL